MMLVVGPARIIGPLAAGAAIDAWGYAPAVASCVGCAVVALGVLWAGRRQASMARDRT